MARDFGNMIVGNPAQMPHQPCDRVRFAVEAIDQLIGSHAIDDTVHQIGNPAERVNQQITTCHVDPPFESSLTATSLSRLILVPILISYSPARRWSLSDTGGRDRHGSGP